MSYGLFRPRTLSTESLQGDDEEQYVYFDEAGQVQKKIEVTVTWNSAPHKKMLVTLLKSDTISYLESKIGECMEKFELFEGLTSLRAVRLFNGKQLLPKKGLLEGAVKSGDHLWCDLTSRDLWIDVHMNLINAKLTLFFEMRVWNHGEVGEFCKMLVEIANLYLANINSPLVYTVSDLTMEKREFNQVLLHRKSARTSSFEETCTLFTPQDSQKIEDCFSFLARSVRCHLYRRHDIDTTVCPIDTDMDELEHFGEYPIRNLRVENLHRESLAPDLQLEPEIAVATNRGKCCCGVWC